MRNNLRRWITASVLAAFLGLLAGAAAQATAPHRALYSFSVSGPTDVGIEGELATMSATTCEAMRQVDEMALRLQLPGGQIHTIAQSREILEALDGSRYTATERLEQNGVVANKSITAERRADGAFDTSIRTDQGETHGRLPAETLMPLGFERDLLTAARRSENSFSALAFFDPIGDAAETSSFFGPPRDSADYQSHAGDRLTQGPVRHVRTAIYRRGQANAEPILQLEYELDASGVVPVLFLELGPLLLEAQLTQLEYLLEPAC